MLPTYLKAFDKPAKPVLPCELFCVAVKGSYDPVDNIISFRSSVHSKPSHPSFKVCQAVELMTRRHLELLSHRVSLSCESNLNEGSFVFNSQPASSYSYVTNSFLRLQM